MNTREKLMYVERCTMQGKISMTRKKLISKCGFKTKLGNDNVHYIAFNELTDGEVLALINALKLARTVSAVAQDLSDYLRNALQESQGHASVSGGLYNKLKDFIDVLNADLGLALIRRDDLEQMRKELLELRKTVADLRGPSHPHLF